MSVFDDNAEVLSRMEREGDDLLKARDIEFAHVFEDRAAADAFRGWAEQQGHAAAVTAREDGRADVIVCRTMVPELQALTELELDLAAAAERYGGDADGWGCFTAPRLNG